MPLCPASADEEAAWPPLLTHVMLMGTSGSALMWVVVGLRCSSLLLWDGVAETVVASQGMLANVGFRPLCEAGMG